MSGQEKTTWNRDDDDAGEYRASFNGKFEDETCVEACASTPEGREGWVRRVWKVGHRLRDKKFYGVVHVVRVK